MALPPRPISCRSVTVSFFSWPPLSLPIVWNGEIESTLFVPCPSNGKTASKYRFCSALNERRMEGWGWRYLSVKQSPWFAGNHWYFRPDTTKTIYSVEIVHFRKIRVYMYLCGWRYRDRLERMVSGIVKLTQINWLWKYGSHETQNINKDSCYFFFLSLSRSSAFLIDRGWTQQSDRSERLSYHSTRKSTILWIFNWEEFYFSQR